MQASGIDSVSRSTARGKCQMKITKAILAVPGLFLLTFLGVAISQTIEEATPAAPEAVEGEATPRPADGDGSRSVDGTGIESVDGTGIQSVEGTGTRSVDGTGMNSVDGTGIQSTETPAPEQVDEAPPDEG